LSTRQSDISAKKKLILTDKSFSCSFAQDTLKCLRAVDVNTLQNANLDINNSGFFGTFVFVPVVDGRFITDRPSKLLKAGTVNGVRSPSPTTTKSY
jgi:cholinesterase